MSKFEVKIVKFLDDGTYPPFVEARFTDAWEKEHIFIEKVPVIMRETFNENTKLPTQELVPCELVKRWVDSNGRKIVTVSTEKPYSIYSTKDLLEFDLLEEQLIQK